MLRQVAKIERPAGVGVPDTVRGESHKKGKNRYEGNWKCAKSFACNPHDVLVESCRLFDGASRVTSHVCECGLTPPVLYGIGSVEGSGCFIRRTFRRCETRATGKNKRFQRGLHSSGFFRKHTEVIGGEPQGADLKATRHCWQRWSLLERRYQRLQGKSGLSLRPSAVG